MGLQDVAEWLHYCGRCNSCKYIYRNYEASCPAFEKFKWESYTSSGKVWIARDLYEGKYPLTESVRQKIFSCTLCGNCTIQCQQLVSDHALDIFEALREECVDAGLISPVHQAFRENVDKVNNPYGNDHEERWAGIESKYFRESAEVLFFVGCTTALRNKELFKDTLEVLEYLDVDFTLSQDEWCCGSPLLTTGQKKAAERLATHNSNLFKQLGVKTVITACAGCFRTLKKQYPEKFNLLTPENSDIQVLHVSQFINSLIKKKGLISPEKITVTYHDPCHLGRHVGVYEEPREVIHKMKNVNFVEMGRNRDNAWCCGAGAGVKSDQKEWAVEISENRLEEALRIPHLDYVISTCPFCERNLEDALQSLRKKDYEGAENIEIIDLIQLVKKFKKPKQS